MNHIIKNIMTKGWLNISILTKGFILPYFKYEIIKRKTGGSSPYISTGYNEENLIKELHSLKNEDVDLIKVYVDWDKKKHKHKDIYVELIKKKLEVKLLEQHKDTKIEVIIL